MRKRFNGMSIRLKLLAAFLMITTISIILSVITIIDMRDTLNRNQQIYSDVIRPMDYLSRATNRMEKIKTDWRSVLISRSIKSQEGNIEQINEYLNEIYDLMAQFKEHILREESRELYDDLISELDEYLLRMTEYEEILYNGDDTSAVEFLENTLTVISNNCMDIMAELNNIKLDVGEDLTSVAIEKTTFSLYLLIVFAVCGVLLAIIFVIYFSKSISNPILMCKDIMAMAADGDFTVRLPSNYGAEIGQLFAACNALNAYNERNALNLKETIATMRGSSQNMLSISTHMANNSKRLNEQTTSVSSATEEFSVGMIQSSNSLSTASSHISAVASSIVEINSTISAVAAAAEETSQRVDLSSTLVDNIKNSISKASDTITLVSSAFNSTALSVDEINKSIFVITEHSEAAMKKMLNADEKTKNTNLMIKRLETASKQIGKIINVINDVADQTNMLALNAAIEAAGAGEVGKGFMVVANEVKELAKQTAEATNEIADKIENMQINIHEAVVAVSEITEIINDMTGFMNSFANEITQQGKRSDQIAEESSSAARKINEITSEINSISDNALSVTLAVVDSTKGVNEIAKSTAELVIGTQEIAMNSERASNNISEINRAMKEMSSGLIDISKTIQLISGEASAVQKSADSTNASSGELLKTASNMEEFISKFTIR